MCLCVFKCLLSGCSPHWGVFWWMRLSAFIDSLFSFDTAERFTLKATHSYTPTVQWTKEGTQCVCVPVCVLTQQNSIDLWPEQKSGVCMEDCIIYYIIEKQTSYLPLYLRFQDFYIEFRSESETLLILSTHNVWHIINAWIILVIICAVLTH